jgi:hypothetical protein
MGIIVNLKPIPADRVEILSRDPDALREMIQPDTGTSLDKMWHAVHYLLTGMPLEAEPPLGLAVVGGDHFGPDLDGREIRLVRPAQVREVDAALSRVTEAEVAGYFDPQAMDDDKIYPENFWVRNAHVGLNHILPCYRALVSLYSDAARRGDAILQWVD